MFFISRPFISLKIYIGGTYGMVFLWLNNRGISSTCRAIRYIVHRPEKFRPGPRRGRAETALEGEQYHVLPAKWKIFVLLSTIHPLNTPFV